MMNPMVQMVMQMRMSGMTPHAAMERMAQQYPMLRDPKQMEAGMRQAAQRMGIDLNALAEQAKRML